MPHPVPITDFPLHTYPLLRQLFFQGVLTGTRTQSSSQSAKCCGHSLSGDGDMKHGSSLQEAYGMTGCETKVSNSVSSTKEIS